MKRKELIDEVAKRAEVSKTDAARYLNAVLGAIADNLSEGDRDIAIPDFGRFSVRHVPARQGQQTGEKITIGAHDKIVFKASDNIGIYSRKHC